MNRFEVDLSNQITSKFNLRPSIPSGRAVALLGLYTSDVLYNCQYTLLCDLPISKTQNRRGKRQKYKSVCVYVCECPVLPTTVPATWIVYVLKQYRKDIVYLVCVNV